MAQERTFVADILGLLGMSQPEAVEYLRARGLKTSYGSVKGWCRGLYLPPADAVEELIELWLDVRDGNSNAIPPDAPESVKLRCDAIRDLQDLVDEVEHNRKAR